MPIQEKTSQFLDSRPQQPLLIGFVSMTGKGIEEEIDDLSFCSETHTKNEMYQRSTKEEKIAKLGLIRKLGKKTN